MRITGHILVIIPQWLRVFIYDRGISIQYNIRVVYLHNIFFRGNTLYRFYLLEIVDFQWRCFRWHGTNAAF